MVLQSLQSSEEKKNGFLVPVGVSARHVHLTQEHVEELFGKGYQLTKKKELMAHKLQRFFHRSRGECYFIKIGTQARYTLLCFCLLYTSRCV